MCSISSASAWTILRHASCSVFAAEAHLTYAQELPLDAPIEVAFQMIDCDAKRLHFFQRMFHAEQRYLAATQEQLSLHVDMKTRRTAPFPGEIQTRLRTLAQQHAELPRPEEVGRKIGIRR